MNFKILARALAVGTGVRAAAIPTGLDPEGKMKFRWRTALLVVALLTASVFLAAPAAAAGKGAGLFPAGTYRLLFASADFSGSMNNLQISFFDVTAGTVDARPVGAPETTTSSASIFMSVFDYSTFTSTFVCETLEHPSDFVIDRRLGSASLNTTLPAGAPDCFGSPSTSDIAIHASWTGVGPLGNSSDANNYACAGYTAESSGVSLINTATASLALTVDGTTTTFSSGRTSISSNDSRVDAHGAIDPGCGPTGLGSGPVAAGHYRFNALFANGFFMPQPFQFNDVSLVETTNSSQPGSPAASSPEFDLNVSLFGGAINGFGCFAIPQSDVVLNGIDSASVQTTTSGSPLCTNSFPGFGLNFPLTVDAAWAANGPLITLHDQNTFHCLGYTNSTSTFVKTTGADPTATVTMPDDFGNPQTVVLTGGFGSLTHVNQTIQANGVLSDACLFRG